MARTAVVRETAPIREVVLTATRNGDRVTVKPISNEQFRLEAVTFRLGGVPNVRFQTAEELREFGLQLVALAEGR